MHATVLFASVGRRLQVNVKFDFGAVRCNCCVTCCTCAHAYARSMHTHFFMLQTDIDRRANGAGPALVLYFNMYTAARAGRTNVQARQYASDQDRDARGGACS